MDRFKVVVEFTVLAEPLGPWTAEQCAADFVAHRIDEGYPMESRIEGWEFVDVRKVEHDEPDAVDGVTRPNVI